MIINETELDLAVIEDNEQTWKLPRKLAFAPPIFEVCEMFYNRVFLSGITVLLCMMEQKHRPVKFCQWSFSISVFTFQSDFQIGVVVNDKVHASEPVNLSEDNPRYRYLTLNTTLYKEGYVKLDVPIVTNDTVQKVVVSIFKLYLSTAWLFCQYFKHICNF